VPARLAPPLGFELAKGTTVARTDAIGDVPRPLYPLQANRLQLRGRLGLTLRRPAR